MLQFGKAHLALFGFKFRLFRVIDAFALFMGLLLFTFQKPAAAQSIPKVVILNAYHQGEDWSDNEIYGIQQELKTAYPFLVPSIEHLDAKRFPDPDHLLFEKQYLKSKYKGNHIDLVMTLDNPAFELMLKFGDELFPDVPIVFAGVNGFRPENLAGRKNITGVAEIYDIEGTLDIALKVRPKTKIVLAIHDYTSSGIAVREDMETAATKFKGRVKIIYTQEESANDLVAELKSLPSVAIALILTYVADNKGRIFTR